MKVALDTNLLVRQALQWFAAGPADFSDCLLAARARSAGCETVLTLNRRAAKTTTHRLLK